MFCGRPEERILLDRWNDFALFVLSFLENLNFFWTKLNFNTFQNFNCLFLPSSFLSHCKIKFQYYSINLDLSFLDILHAMFNQFYYFPHSTKMQTKLSSSNNWIKFQYCCFMNAQIWVLPIFFHKNPFSILMHPSISDTVTFNYVSFSRHFFFFLKIDRFESYPHNEGKGNTFWKKVTEPIVHHNYEERYVAIAALAIFKVKLLQSCWHLNSLIGVVGVITSADGS